ncbi:glycosyltransferase [uncultured Nostoc sp.]|uniref:MGDG synthase family glycosyltransferase n=1 Tax=uncultured Nostoc sp. TaxID=340711 RepID=UPI0035CBB866
MTRIDLIFYSGGGGHRSTANALSQVINKQQPNWQPRLVNIEEIENIEQADMFYKMTGKNGNDIYNLVLKKGWTFLIPLFPLLRTLAKANIRQNYSELIALLENHWGKNQPDLVVSCIPFYNRVLRESLQKAMPTTPFVTILTDFADSPPHFWIEPQEQFLICPTEQAVEQARALGHQEKRIFRTSGLVINPRFYEPITVDRRSERQRLDLDPDLPTGLVLFGGYGSKVILEIAQRLECFQDKLQLIFLCGRNEELASALLQSQGFQKRFVTTFTEDIPYYMHLADFFIGKPGPGSLSEATAMKLPVITERNALTMIQETFSCEWITDKEVGIVISNFHNIERAVEKLIQPENYSHYRANLNTLNNQAVFETVDILEKILKAPI